MDTTRIEKAAEIAETPRVQHAKHAGLIPGVPLKEQLGGKSHPKMEGQATFDGGALGIDSAPSSIRSWEKLAKEVKHGPAPSADGRSKKKKEKLKQQEKKPKHKRRRGATLVGKAARTGKTGWQCHLCLLWFPERALKEHFRECKRTASSRQVRCTVCSVSFPAFEVYPHLRVCQSGSALRLPQAPEIRGKKQPIRHGNKIERVEAVVHSLPAGQFDDAVHTVPFEILPPGSGGIKILIARLKRLSKNSRRATIEKEFYWERFDYLLSLGPVDHWEGKLAWRGYIAFVFPKTDTVILECARKGNATYLLNGRWQEMISATKTELRSEYRHESRRIFHTAGWESNILLVVSGRWRFSPY